MRLVLEHRSEYPSTTAAVLAVSKQVGVGKESLRRWVAQAEVDAGDRPGVTTSESAEIRKLKAENHRLREDNEILKAGGCRMNRRDAAALREAAVGRNAKYSTRGLQLQSGRSGTTAADAAIGGRVAPGGPSGLVRDRCRR